MSDMPREIQAWNWDNRFKEGKWYHMEGNAPKSAVKYHHDDKYKATVDLVKQLEKVLSDGLNEGGEAYVWLHEAQEALAAVEKWRNEI